jgi:hypothetical protein
MLRHISKRMPDEALRQLLRQTTNPAVSPLPIRFRQSENPRQPLQTPPGEQALHVDS